MCILDRTSLQRFDLGCTCLRRKREWKNDGQWCLHVFTTCSVYILIDISTTGGLSPWSSGGTSRSARSSSRWYCGSKDSWHQCTLTKEQYCELKKLHVVLFRQATQLWISKNKEDSKRLHISVSKVCLLNPSNNFLVSFNGLLLSSTLSLHKSMHLNDRLWELHLNFKFSLHRRVRTYTRASGRCGSRDFGQSDLFSILL